MQYDWNDLFLMQNLSTDDASFGKGDEARSKTKVNTGHGRLPPARESMS